MSCANYGNFVAVGGAVKAAPADSPAVSDLPLTTVPVTPGSFDPNAPPELLVHAAVKLTSTRKTKHRAIATRVSQLANWRIPIIQTSQSQHSLEYGKDPDAPERAYASTIFHRVQTVGHTISAEGKRAIPHPFHRLDSVSLTMGSTRNRITVPPSNAKIQSAVGEIPRSGMSLHAPCNCIDRPSRSLS